MKRTVKASIEKGDLKIELIGKIDSGSTGIFTRNEVESLAGELRDRLMTQLTHLPNVRTRLSEIKVQ